MFQFKKEPVNTGYSKYVSVTLKSREKLWNNRLLFIFRGFWAGQNFSTGGG